MSGLHSAAFLEPLEWRKTLARSRPPSFILSRSYSEVQTCAMRWVECDLGMESKGRTTWSAQEGKQSGDTQNVAEVINWPP